MSEVRQHLIEQLTTALSPEHLEVVNESDKHAGHAGYAENSHYRITVVSSNFDGMRLVDRHRFINELFREELEHIHAMAMHTYTPSEWDKKNSS